jgi:glyoxylase-like metal-dependent hydrolase (beta-lactamase superfamily II)
MELRTLEHDIHVVQPRDALRQPAAPAALFIVNEADVVVVSPGGAMPWARDIIRLVRSVTHKPVSVVINTHRHGGQADGNRAWGEVFPGVRIIEAGGAGRDPAEGGEMVLRRGAREIHVRHQRNAAGDGEVVVWLPAERILAGGAFMVAPVPRGVAA